MLGVISFPSVEAWGRALLFPAFKRKIRLNKSGATFVSACPDSHDLAITKGTLNNFSTNFTVSKHILTFLFEAKIHVWM